RLERLQRVVTKLQMESGLCEEQLNQADALLQADVRLLAAGKAPQKAAEVERDLDKADAMIRLLFNDVQSLKDGRHPQGEQMYRRYGPVPVALCPQSPSCPPCPSFSAPKSPLWPPKALHVSSVPRVPCAPKALQNLLRRIRGDRGCEGQLGGDEGAGCGRAGPGHSCHPPVPPQNSSKSRLRHLESLHGFVSGATKELLWLSEREEEEVAFDWSHNNPAMAAKKESYS
ncbi:PLEC protein, partial [Poecile atricapillus]|nr:PLEC protein [Poecile atricapillus]